MSSINEQLKDDIIAVIYSIFMIIYTVVMSYVIEINNGLFVAGNCILYGLAVVAIILTLIGICTRRLFLIKYYTLFITELHGSIYYIAFSIVNIYIFFTIWRKDDVREFVKSSSKNFDDYSKEQLKKYFLLGSFIMNIAGIIQLVLLRMYYKYLNKYIEKVKINNSHSNKNHRKYIKEEKDAIAYSLGFSAWILLPTLLIFIFINFQKKSINNVVLVFLFVNSLYGIISNLLIALGVYMRKSALIFFYRKFPWNKSLLCACVIQIILLSINFFIGRKEIYDSIFDKSRFDELLLLMIFNSLGIIHLFFLYKSPYYLDKVTNNVVNKYTTINL